MPLPIAPTPVAAAAEAAPVDQAMGDMFANYNPEGSLNGLFAPAFIKGYAPSEAAVGAWHKKNNPISYTDVDALRMPNKWMPAQPPGGLPSYDVYGAGRIPNSLRYGDDRGEVDPAALISLAQGGPYDVEARREAIAKRVQENKDAEAKANGPAAGGALGAAGFGDMSGAAAAMGGGGGAAPTSYGDTGGDGFPAGADSPLRLGGSSGARLSYGGGMPSEPWRRGANGEWLWWG